MPPAADTIAHIGIRELERAFRIVEGVDSPVMLQPIMIACLAEDVVAIWNIFVMSVGFATWKLGASEAIDEKQSIRSLTWHGNR